MNLTIRQFRAFIAVANTHSFTAAGQLLFITQGAVSSLIRDLEAQMGISLFDRCSRHVTLSPDGKSFLPIASRAVDEFDRAERYAKELHKARLTLVRIVGAPLIASTLLPIMIGEFTRKNPDIHIELIDHPMSLLQSCVLSGDADFGIGPQRWLEPDLMAETLFSTPISVLCRPDHKFVENFPCWQDLKDEQVIGVGDESIAFISADSGVPIKARRIVNQMATAMSLAAQGAGIVLAGPFSMRMARGYYLTLCPLLPIVKRNMNIYSHTTRELSPAAQKFKQFLQQYVTENDPNAYMTL